MMTSDKLHVFFLFFHGKINNKSLTVWFQRLFSGGFNLRHRPKKAAQLKAPSEFACHEWAAGCWQELQETDTSWQEFGCMGLEDCQSCQSICIEVSALKKEVCRMQQPDITCMEKNPWIYWKFVLLGALQRHSFVEFHSFMLFQRMERRWDLEALHLNPSKVGSSL